MKKIMNLIIGMWMFLWVLNLGITVWATAQINNIITHYEGLTALIDCVNAINYRAYLSNVRIGTVMGVIISTVAIILLFVMKKSIED